MPHVFEVAPTGRAKCRGCGQTIDKGALRFGEHVPNQYGEGEATLWFHPRCAAFKRPEPLLESLAAAPEDRDELERIARASALHKRVPRVDGAERASSGQAACRHCREKIERGAWRIRLTIYDEGRFAAAGFIHMSCRPAYFEDHDVREAMLHFSPKLDDEERTDLLRAYES
jgi:ribosomal protein L37AE/L43A